MASVIFWWGLLWLVWFGVRVSFVRFMVAVGTQIVFDIFLEIYVLVGPLANVKTKVYKPPLVSLFSNVCNMSTFVCCVNL